jgi:hypothetical protein
VKFWKAEKPISVKSDSRHSEKNCRNQSKGVIAMRFQKITGISRNGSKHVRFAGSQSEAASVRKTLNRDCDVPRDAISTDEIDIEPNKAGILAALNQHCGSN